MLGANSLVILSGIIGNSPYESVSDSYARLRRFGQICQFWAWRRLILAETGRSSPAVIISTSDGMDYHRQQHWRYLRKGRCTHKYQSKLHRKAGGGAFFQYETPGNCVKWRHCGRSQKEYWFFRKMNGKLLLVPTLSRHL